MDLKPSKPDDLLARIEKWVVAIAIAFAASLVCVAVVLRYGFGYSMSAFDELTRFAIVFATFVGASRLLHQGGHVSVDILLVNLPVRARNVLLLIAYVAGALFCLALAFFGIRLVGQTMNTGMVSMSNLRIPMWIPQLAVPLGASLLFIRFVQKVVDIALGLRRSNADPAVD